MKAEEFSSLRFSYSHRLAGSLPHERRGSPGTVYPRRELQEKKRIPRSSPGLYVLTAAFRNESKCRVSLSIGFDLGRLTVMPAGEHPRPENGRGGWGCDAVDDERSCC